MLLRLSGAEAWLLILGIPLEEDMVALDGGEVVPGLLVIVMHGSHLDSWSLLGSEPAAYCDLPFCPSQGVTALQRLEHELPLVRRKNRKGFRPGGAS